MSSSRAKGLTEGPEENYQQLSSG